MRFATEIIYILGFLMDTNSVFCKQKLYFRTKFRRNSFCIFYQNIWLTRCLEFINSYTKDYVWQKRSAVYSFAIQFVSHIVLTNSL